MNRKPLAFGLTYMALSIAIEVVLLVVVRLRIPEDNAIIAPILLIVSPIAAGLMCGYGRPKALIVVALATVLLTVVFVMAFERMTGISTGLAPPIVLRTLAGYLAAVAANSFTRSRTSKIEAALRRLPDRH